MTMCLKQSAAYSILSGTIFRKTYRPGPEERPKILAIFSRECGFRSSSLKKISSSWAASETRQDTPKCAIMIKSRRAPGPSPSLCFPFFSLFPQNPGPFGVFKTPRGNNNFLYGVFSVPDGRISGSVTVHRKLFCRASAFRQTALRQPDALPTA